MVNVPSKEARKQKYLNSIGGVPASYKMGVEGTTDWKEKAINGQGLYIQRMQDQSVLARREKGLQKVSDADWRQKASNLGSQRIAAGMTAGAEKQAANYEPIAAALRSVQLPDRTTDAMANIDNRVKPIVAAAMAASPKNQ